MNKLIFLLCVGLTISTSVHAGGLQPYLPHLPNHQNYDPLDAWKLHAVSGRADLVVQQANAFHGTNWTTDYVGQQIALHALGAQSAATAVALTERWTSWGFRIGTKGTVEYGWIDRDPYVGEMILQIDGKDFFSLVCGQGRVAAPAPLVTKCRRGHSMQTITEVTEYSDVLVGNTLVTIPNAVTTLTAESYPFDCQTSGEPK